MGFKLQQHPKATDSMQARRRTSQASHLNQRTTCRNPKPRDWGCPLRSAAAAAAAAGADSQTRQRNLSSKLTYRHIEISGAPLPLTDTRADQSQGAKGGRIWSGLHPLANSAVLSNDATVLNASSLFCYTFCNVEGKKQAFNENLPDSTNICKLFTQTNGGYRSLWLHESMAIKSE